MAFWDVRADNESPLRCVTVTQTEIPAADTHGAVVELVAAAAAAARARAACRAHPPPSRSSPYVPMAHRHTTPCMRRTIRTQHFSPSSKRTSYQSVDADTLLVITPGNHRSCPATSNLYSRRRPTRSGSFSSMLLVLVRLVSCSGLSGQSGRSRAVSAR